MLVFYSPTLFIIEPVSIHTCLLFFIYYDIMVVGEKMENKEYLQIVEKFLENRKFGKLKNETHHHNSNRFNHSVEVSYKSYKICKKLK